MTQNVTMRCVQYKSIPETRAIIR